ncbi:hypothetical protein A6F68_01156 [Tsuneonella dongtanensis]|uniref:TspO/MBR family protein n=1 Tax=Tsuneonella dongtanensis TaxID=692370 RepID=A0A1B2AC47_9SPHN|nr:hypothetical protein [Tsuneonella dongtanensis]ANY19674.1 hypothetical protein A6F68_01156 [Tsuneonella dongtanensis]
MSLHSDEAGASALRPVAQKVAVLMAVILQIGAGFLPRLGIGQEVGARSDTVDTLVTPAGWAFAIWGPLFAGAVLFSIYQLLPAQRADRLLDRVAWPAAGTFAANGVWSLYVQTAAIDAVSVVIIAASLACALIAYRRIARFERPLATRERWLVMLPLSALAAWLTAATIVNVTSALTFYGWGGNGSQPALAAAIIIVGGVIAALAVYRERGNPVYAAVFLYALFAIHADGGQRASLVAFATLAAALTVIFATVAALRHVDNRRRWFG